MYLLLLGLLSVLCSIFATLLYGQFFFLSSRKQNLAVASDIKFGVIGYSRCSLIAVNYCQKLV